ncbi:MAG: site-specific integrase [Oscillospiraceae bacterium]|nr:site-specific integrase [Oscillospiraceae bacterium]
MQGSVRKKGATWSYRVEFGMVGGKRNQIERSGFRTKSDATKAMNEVIYNYNMTGDFVENKKITFCEVYNEFIEKEAPATRAYATVVRYKSLYRNHLQEHFDRYYMYQITSSMIDDFINLKMKSYSEEYVKGLFKMLKVLFGFAHKRQYMKKNIFPTVTAPPDPRHVGEIKTYSDEERRLIEKRLQGTNIIVSYYIALNTGLRESEVFALQWSDIDFENKKIKVWKQLLFQDRKWCFCPLKTKNAYRSVNITDSFCEYLKKLKEHHEDNKELYGEGYKRNFVTNRLERNKEFLMQIDDFVNIKLNGDMLTTNSIKFMSRVCKNDLGINFKFHNLRHTYATILAESGVSPRYVQEMLGHSKLEFTLRYYTHVTEKMGVLARNALESTVTFTIFNDANMKPALVVN